MYIHIYIYIYIYIHISATPGHATPHHATPRRTTPCHATPLSMRISHAPRRAVPCLFENKKWAICSKGCLNKLYI